MPYAKSSDLRIYWDEKGAGSPLLLVMGARYSSRMWYPVIDALAARHRVIWFDNRGIGKSQRTRHGSIQDMAGDAVAVLDAAGVDRAHIYGCSLGGVVTIQLALQSPERVRSLILGCTGILSDEKPRGSKAANVMAHLPHRVLAALGKNGYGSAATAEAVARDLAVLRSDKASAAGLKQQMDAFRAYSVTRKAVAAFRFPTLILHGSEDKVASPGWGQELADLLTHSKHVVYEGAGHNFLVSYGDQANADVLAFLAGIPE